MNQTFYFNNVFLGGNDGGSFLYAIFNRRQVVNLAIGFRVLQKAQILFGLLVFQKVDSAMNEIKRFIGVVVVKGAKCNLSKWKMVRK